ncbi:MULTISPECIES: helix-turn-helix transcriptional regulator [unclassified Brevundimonas]|uniref:helix-turn-helix transcriptional regulator n=1 Tax=unclassified Brevundimonas TaxID=2622653 RepID=UPI0025C166A9|nr:MULTISPECIES: AlpA family phage regulatory protein [unclassified Brevundimonas]
MTEDGFSGEEGAVPQGRLLVWSEVRALVGVSRTTAWRLQRTGGFPASVALSPGRVGWWESELEAWRKNRDRRRWRSPSSPRLEGMGRRSRKPREESLASEPEVKAPETPPRTARRTRRSAVHPDQIDFDF